MPDQARLDGHPLVVALRLLQAGAPERIGRAAGLAEVGGAAAARPGRESAI